MPRIRVWLLEKREEFRQCERIQKAVWGNVGVGSEVLTVTRKYGGVVLGASVNGEMAGCLYAFLARRRGRLIHWSHIMAVRRAYRNLGLGFRMKLAHRRLALAQGMKSICWTFDPLQSRNAALNLARLGARVEEYIPDCYGKFPSAIEKGLPSDRVVVNWPIASRLVERRLRLGPPPSDLPAYRRVNETRINARGLLENRRIHLSLRERRLLVEIPSNTDQMRARDLALARRWRLEMRRVFLRYLAAGYAVRDFLRPVEATAGRCFYLLVGKGRRG
jgi:predicted GNAT superfamily acetyltransferase